MIKFFKAMDAMTEEDTRRPWWKWRRKPKIDKVALDNTHMYFTGAELREAEKRVDSLLAEVREVVTDVARLSIAFERARRNAK